MKLAVLAATAGFDMALLGALSDYIPLPVLSLLAVLVYDLVFAFLCVAPVLLLALFFPPAFAVLKRNFVGYFSNPTGYVFLVMFVIMTSTAAFWPHEFFTSNLANLDQLNRYIPFIMLVFIPAITMSAWAEERRQGTDELLLTLPATDFDIVIGKYMAAAAIFTVSLLFAQLSHISVLVALTIGDLDIGLLAVTYFGYWLMGLAMLSVGMVASFFTRNLTIGFVLGAVLNAPLAFTSSAGVIVGNRWLAEFIRHWSLGGQFDSFGRGIVSLSALAYFAMLIGIGLYLCMMLIGRRHWMGGRDGSSMLGHYLFRIVALLVIGVGLNVVLVHTSFLNLRGDLSENQISSLSPDTVKLLNELQERTEQPIRIDAFLSAEVPPDYVKTRYDLINMLKEFEAAAVYFDVDQKKFVHMIDLRLHDNLEASSDEAKLASDRYGIEPQRVTTRNEGEIKDEDILLAAAFTCGLERVVVPFFDYGVPVEYELIRSVATVAREKRKKVGVLRTDAQLNGGFSFGMGGSQNIPKQAIVEELEKQYDVEEVDTSSPLDVWIEEEEDGKKTRRLKYDVLLAVQPSSLEPQQLDNLVKAIEQGQPTAIFEDPLPTFINAPGTSQDRQQNPMMMMMGRGGPPPPKGEIKKIWDLLGIDPGGERKFDRFQAEIVWQKYNPYRQYRSTMFPAEFVIVRPELQADNGPFNNEESITSGLEEVLFPFPGSISRQRDSDLTFTPLINTGNSAGTISFEDLQMSQRGADDMDDLRGEEKGEFVLAAHIHGKLEVDESATSEVALKEGETELNVVYVADIDVLSTPFVNVRARPHAGEGVKYRFDNVTFVLNVLDVLAGEKDFVEIRKRKIRHSTLKFIELQDEIARENEFLEREKYDKTFEDAKKAAMENRDKAVAELRKIVDEYKQRRDQGQDVDPAEFAAKERALGIKLEVEERKYQNEEERAERERDAKIADIRRQLDLSVRGIQNQFKWYAVTLPPILPALVGLVVFVRRRLREREGVTKARLR